MSEIKLSIPYVLSEIVFEEFEGEVKKAVEGVLDREIDEKYLEEPPKEEFGDLACTVTFKLAKGKGKSPKKIAQELKEKIEPKGLIENIETKGPYLNFYMDKIKLANYIIPQINQQGHLKPDMEERKVHIEHTSVNPGKPWHMGHARNAIIGDIMSRVYEFAGHDIITTNYIDNLGRQAATTTWALKNIRDKIPKEDKKTDFWHGLLYSKAAQMAKDDPDVKKEIDEFIKKIDKGDNEVADFNRKVCEESLKSQLKTAWRMNIYYDLLLWENNIVETGLLEEAIDAIKDSDRIYTPNSGENKGCLVYNLKGYEAFSDLKDFEKVLIRSNGASTYVAKDIAFQRWKFGLTDKDFNYTEFLEQPNGETLLTTAEEGELSPYDERDEVINVVGYEQEFEQKIVYHALKLDGHEKESEKSTHLSYKWVWLPDQKFSGRKGNWVGYHTDAVLDKTKGLALEKVRDNLPELGEEEQKQIAEKIAVGALKFSISSSDLKKKITFDFDRALSFTGETGPYCQYACVRANKILEKIDPDPPKELVYNKPEEQRLVKKLAQFPDVVETAIQDHSPSKIPQYTYDLAEQFSNFYEKCPVTTAKDEQVKKSRARLVKATKFILKTCLNDLLGIEVPEQM